MDIRDSRVLQINGTSRMPYRDSWKETPNEARNSGRSRPATNRKGNNKSANLTKAVVRQMIDSKLNVEDEKKWILNEYTATGVDSAGIVLDLTAITQGIGDTGNRVGDQIVLDRARLSYAVASADTTNVVRVLIFKWMPQSVPVITNLLTSGGSQIPWAPHNTDTADQYQVLYDRLHFLAASGPGIDGDVLEIKLPGKVQFSGGSTTGTGKIYLILVSDSGAIPHPVMNLNCALYYEDP
jgi:hypothetical protein